MSKLNIFIEERIATIGSYFDSSFGNFLPEEEVEEVYHFTISDDAFPHADIVAEFVERRNFSWGHLSSCRSETGTNYVVQSLNDGSRHLYIYDKGEKKFIKMKEA